MRTVVHPGPPAPERLEIVPAEGTALRLTLPADRPLEDAVNGALADAGFDSGWLWLDGAPVADLAYVVPAPSPDADHAAWYSDTFRFDGPGRIDRLGMIVGRRDGRAFVHGHGLWQPEGGAVAMGHILGPQTRLSAPATVTGIGLRGARFDATADAETNFTLFRPRATGAAGAADCALLRLAPNEDFATALDRACARLGWAAARAHGLGSLLGARFSDGTTLDSDATEFLVIDATTGVEPAIEIVGTRAGQIAEGRLARGANPVLVTAEIVLQRLG